MKLNYPFLDSLRYPTILWFTLLPVSGCISPLVVVCALYPLAIITLVPTSLQSVPCTECSPPSLNPSSELEARFHPARCRSDRHHEPIATPLSYPPRVIPHHTKLAPGGKAIQKLDSCEVVHSHPGARLRVLHTSPIYIPNGTGWRGRQLTYVVGLRTPRPKKKEKKKFIREASLVWR